MKQNQPDQAIIHFKNAVQEKPDNWLARVNLGLVLWGMGRKAEAIEQYEFVVEHDPDYNPTLSYNIACYYSLAGRTTLGMEWLEKAIKHGYNNWELIKTDPDLQNLRERPDFFDLPNR
jgi:lipopolysaccharide biosynthesis regulator YciM